MGKTLFILSVWFLTVWTTCALADDFNTEIAFTGCLCLSKYFVDPDARLPLSGAGAEISIMYRRDKISYGIGFQYSRVLRGRMDIDAISITAGTRYNVPRNRLSPYFSFDIGPCWLFSGNNRDNVTGYVLETGIRPIVRYGAGMEYDLKGHLALSPGVPTLVGNVTYSFTVKDFYLHNPFTPHKHKDIFHYFSLNLGLGTKKETDP